MASFTKPIREKGIVISKHINEAREASESIDGKKWPARDKEFVVEVISCDEDDFSEETGFPKGTRTEYKVDEETYKKVKFGMWAKVKYIVSQYGQDGVKITPQTFALLEQN